MSIRENITRIKAVNDALEELPREVVFVGGATVALYADRPATEARPTDDVDILVELMHHKDDVMPTGENALGFSNLWYEAGYKTAMVHAIREGYDIRIFQGPYFIASKFEAFNNRGGGDGRFSSDFEDIVFVLNNRTTIWKEMHEADEAVRNYLKSQFEKLLENEYIDEWISSHLEYREQARKGTIFGEMNEFVTS